MNTSRATFSHRGSAATSACSTWAAARVTAPPKSPRRPPGSLGLDISLAAVAFARETFPKPNLSFVCGSGCSLPIQTASVDLVIAFEMIEHLGDWAAMLENACRVLAPAGQFVVSTPNKYFYEESRRKSGPNPFHVHEFDYEEFREELQRFFPHVSLFVQNHGPSIIFQPVERPTGAQVTVEGGDPRPDECNFFIAVCAGTPLTGAPTYVHVPTTGNVLRERSRHIVKLEEELETKNKWLEKLKAEHHGLMEKFRGIGNELQASNQWANQLNSELDTAREQIDDVNAELVALSSGYEKQIAELEAELSSRNRWALATQQKLDKCASLLDAAENTVKERSAWAQRLDAEVEALRAKIALMEASRWLKIGRAIGVGPGAKRK